MTSRDADLEKTIQDFSARLHSEFREAITHDPHGFKRRVVSLIRASLALKSGRPRSEIVTRAVSMHQQGKSWAEIYSSCLPLDSGAAVRQLDQSRLRTAVRARRLLEKKLPKDFVTHTKP